MILTIMGVELSSLNAAGARNAMPSDPFAQPARLRAKNMNATMKRTFSVV